MKKTISILLIAAMLLSMVIATVPAAAAESKAVTAIDPTKIGNVVVDYEDNYDYIEHLESQGYLPLVDDTNVPGLPENAVTPSEIVDNGKYYLYNSMSWGATIKDGIRNIIIDGCGATLTVDKSMFITHVTGLTLKNITIDGSIINDSSDWCGTIIARWDNDGVVHLENVTLADSFKLQTRTGDRFKALGMFVGYSRVPGSTFTNVYVGGEINWLPEKDNNLSIWGQSLDHIGGIAGDIKEATFENVVNACNITIGDGVTPMEVKFSYYDSSKDNGGIGGIVGTALGKSTFTNCLNKGNITIKDKVEIVDTRTVEVAAEKVGDYAEGTLLERGGKFYDRESFIGTYAKNGIGGLGGIVGIVNGNDISFTNVINTGEIKLEFDNSVEKFVSEKVGKDGKPVEIKGTVHRELNVGGIVGKVQGSSTFTMTDCENQGNVTLDKARAWGLGGIVGKLATGAKVDMTNCNNKAAISGGLGQPSDDGLGAGGIVGISKTSSEISVYDCDNSGTLTINTFVGVYSDKEYQDGVDGEGNPKYKSYEFHTGVGAVGGIYGYQYATACDSLNISLCDNTGEIKQGASSNMAIGFGGVVGSIRGTTEAIIYRCTNSSNISVNGRETFTSGAGGILGMYGSIGNWMHNNNADVKATLDIRMCKNVGNISGALNCGGVFGAAHKELVANNLVTNIYGCVNEGKVESTKNDSNAGGILGCSALLGTLNITYCTNNGEVKADKNDSCNASGILGVMNANVKNLSINNCKNTGKVTGGKRAGGIAAKVSATGKITVENCYNTGAISATKDNSTGIAVGIVGSITLKDTSVNGCINAGDVSCVQTTVQLPITTNNSTLKSGVVNYYLTGKGIPSNNTVTHGTAKSQSDITTLEGKLRFTVNGDAFLLKRLIEVVGQYIESDYTADSWKSLKAKKDSADTVVKNLDATQTTIDNAEDALKAAADTLVPKKLDLTGYNKVLDTYNKLDDKLYSGNTFLAVINAMKDVENMKKNDGKTTLQSKFNAAIDAVYAAIEGLEAKGETDGEIDVDNLGELTLPPLRPQPTASSETSNSTTSATTTAATTTTPSEKKGCGGIIGGAAVILAAVAIVGAGVSFKKRED